MKFLVSVFAASLIAGCNSEQPEENKVNPEVIRDAIVATLQDWEKGILPEAGWPEPIKELKPLRIYSDRVNCVIALSQQGEIESGYYVYHPISSYLPSNNDHWTFSSVGEDIWTYERKLGE